jgi:hypothetical protein
MKRKVLFKNHSGHPMYIEFGPQHSEIEERPVIFDNGFDGHAKLALIDIYTSLVETEDVNEKPLTYFRHFDTIRSKFRFGNVVEMGNTFIQPQIGVKHPDQAPQSDVEVSQFRKEGTYGYKSDTKPFEACFDKDGLHLSEGDYLHLRAIPWDGFTIYDHQSTYLNASMIFQPSTYMGDLDGKPVIGLGSYDRFCVRSDISEFGALPFGYITLGAMGIRQDGRKELCNITLSLNGSGQVCAVYKLEGETPVISDEVEMETEWFRLPYVNDGTCVYKDAVFRFAGKEIIFEGQWGSKGFLKEPRLDKHGQSQVFGRWHEAGCSVPHRLSFTFGENMEAFEDNLTALGFDVSDWKER